jgi:hypothetical protein
MTQQTHKLPFHACLVWIGELRGRLDENEASNSFSSLAPRILRSKA